MQWLRGFSPPGGCEVPLPAVAAGVAPAPQGGYYAENDELGGPIFSFAPVEEEAWEDEEAWRELVQMRKRHTAALRGGPPPQVVPGRQR